MKHIQVNLQTHFGGGEVYTAFLCRALSVLGVSTTLFVHPRARFWSALALPADVQIEVADSFSAVAHRLPDGPGWLLGHGPLPPALLAPAQKKNWCATAIAHMPIQGRNPRVFDSHDQVFAVSGWVLDGLRAEHLPAWDTPLYGVAEIKRDVTPTVLQRHSRYDWDRRKFRDRLLGWFEPVTEAVRPRTLWTRKPGLTLGIVSRLTPIKQFPLLLSLLAPILAQHPKFNLEIFGSGGYASVRDLRRALQPLGDRVRFWGHQRDVAAVYRNIDYLLTGLPEKEALGLNVIEAQACGTPVLAVAAAPFTETVLEGATGFFYRDPREDQGADFAQLLQRLQTLATPLSPQNAHAHLEKFSFDALVERLRPVVAWAQAQTT